MKKMKSMKSMKSTKGGNKEINESKIVSKKQKPMKKGKKL